ncbi:MULTISPECIES: hypothetical protein [Methylobacterium]|uniref:Uncharacterized protein n=2 Tax=Pseudomonadota TaxID=1224 RepID=A0ABQ4T152_9HYPH|nr:MULTISPECIES: hypothetical protein [Methylobacterium]PIU04796.1 MAG: hypothetical protein COT56_18465 [Methylobacterium sp. CG09_land_8_20_14_0_10_71_15]PIU16272.1 MAG: hypothetical protein COT28_01250 [Methylobacterium sp. CG08_land_8_20_14_0_20_71_15]GBU17202.1 hypothetical protein AwMethylo_14170 [Methylobacterium sp.]GJE07883.1 hypothetical protein AOPFMNJM_3215 [Methylobacterium jeotgali]
MGLLGWLSNPIGAALGTVGSGLIKLFGNSVLGPILKTLENGQNAQRDVAVQAVQAEMAANQAKAAIAPAFKGLIYGIGIPPAVHFGAICLSKTFDLGWPIEPLPTDYVAIEATILTAFFVSSPLTTLARAGAARLLKA